MALKSLISDDSLLLTSFLKVKNWIFFFCCFCQPYIVDLTLEEKKSYGGFEHVGIPEGIPPLPEYLAAYCSAAVRTSLILFSPTYILLLFSWIFFFQGKPWPVADWKFCVAFSLFRGASIYAGIYHRFILVFYFCDFIYACWIPVFYVYRVIECTCRVMHQGVTVLSMLERVLISWWIEPGSL